MDKFEQMRLNFLGTLKSAEEQTGVDLSFLKFQYMQLFEAAQQSVQPTLLESGQKIAPESVNPYPCDTN